MQIVRYPGVRIRTPKPLIEEKFGVGYYVKIQSDRSTGSVAAYA